MCINEQVKKLRSFQMINDRCLELQKKKKKGLLMLDHKQKEVCSCDGSVSNFYLAHENLYN